MSWRRLGGLIEFGEANTTDASTLVLAPLWGFERPPLSIYPMIDASMVMARFWVKSISADDLLDQRAGERCALVCDEMDEQSGAHSLAAQCPIIPVCGGTIGVAGPISTRPWK